MGQESLDKIKSNILLILSLERLCVFLETSIILWKKDINRCNEIKQDYSVRLDWLFTIVKQTNSQPDRQEGFFVWFKICRLASLES